ncbi:hypothetical protein CIG75_10525 [Tumebacillus algifaecis]|uniref:Uncharacterized protein n=1 Tax=Tumebacillus algifaecis TaxID=1214604 RepID=A0A223D1B8_9BACL|nr:hypothetical protein [Tumebacillus algifaecis]ASS75382.1 hypothetical protein CIG75_10525 [Tumebacillus algifaecis]
MKRTSKRFLPQRSHLILYALALLVAALFLPASVMAHKPIFVERNIGGYEQAYEIPSPSVSYATYGELKTPRAVDVYKITLTEAAPFYARLSVPKQPQSETFGPAFVLFGPGLPTTNEPPNYPLDLPPALGRAILLWKGEADEFYEPFTQTTYLERQLISKTLEPGTYYIAVYDPAGQSGKYVLATGDQEEFGLSDLIKFPATWYKVRMWYNPNQTWLIIACALAFLLSSLYYLKRIRHRPED